MNLTMKRDTYLMGIYRGTFAIGLAIALSGCVSLGGAEPPASLLTLTPDTAVPAGAGVSGTAETAIKIMEPEAPQRLAVNRVPVQVTDTEIAYLQDAVWVERPTRLFRRLLAETIRARGDRLVIDGDDPGIAASLQLRGTMRNFGYDARTSSVVVRFDAIRAAADGAIEAKRFESVQAGVLAEASEVGDALNRAANDVARQVAEWVAA